MWILGNQWVGILPLTNQRPTPNQNWLGNYIQARIQSFLFLNSDWKFHSQETLRLWYFKSKPSLATLTPVNQYTTLLIHGDFQKVIDLMSLTLTITKFDLVTKYGPQKRKKQKGTLCLPARPLAPYSAYGGHAAGSRTVRVYGPHRKEPSLSSFSSCFSSFVSHMVCK